MKYMLYRVLLLSLTLTLGFNSSFSQTISQIKGKVLESKGRTPLPNVVCKLIDSEKHLFSYAITNEKGEFLLKKKKRGTSVSFSMLGYATRTLPINEVNLHTVLLDESSFSLQEVVIKIPPIQTKSDTVAYNVLSFKDKGDRYIEDVIKKLPGVKVAENGAISYQGKPITKFYIEGQDLLGNSYNQATQNLPVEAISQVQVLRNHQPVKALKDKEFSDKAALNLKIKSGYKIKPFGEAQLGGGISPNIWDNHLLTVLLGKKNQLFVNGKMNNCGIDQSLETVEHFDFANLEAFEPLPNQFFRMNIQNNVLLDKRQTYFNKSYSLGVNDLVKLTKNSNLRVNLLSYFDSSNSVDQSIYNYGGAFPLTNVEKNNRKNKVKRYLPILKYELNNNSIYLKDEFKYYLSNENQIAAILNNERNVNQNISYRPTYLQNFLKGVYSTKSHSYDFTSLVRFHEQKEHLSFDLSDEMPDITSGSLNQYKLKKVLARNSLSTYFQLFGKEMKVALLSDYQSLDNILLNPKTDHKFEKTTQQYFNFGTELSYRYNYSCFGYVNVTLPFLLHHNRLTLKNDKNSLQYFAFNPKLRVNHEFNRFFEVRMQASYSTQDDQNVFVFDRPAILKDYRTYYTSNNNLFKCKSLNISASLIYHDLVNCVLGDATVSYTRRKKQFYYDSFYKNDFTTLTPVVQDNYTSLLFATASLDKTFVDEGLGLKCSVDYNYFKSTFSQFGQAYSNGSNYLTAQLTANYKHLKWLKALYTFSANFGWQLNMDKSSVLSNYFNQLQLYFIPHSKLYLSCVAKLHLNEVEEGHYENNFFLDAELTYNLSKRFLVRAKLNNVFDRREYNVTYLTGINQQSFSMPLRGREFLVSCVFKY